MLARAGACKAKAVALRNLYLQCVFAWLTGNGDLHAGAVDLEGLPFSGFPLNGTLCELRFRRGELDT